MIKGLLCIALGLFVLCWSITEDIRFSVGTTLAAVLLVTGYLFMKKS